jgi:hypothetical protein
MIVLAQSAPVTPFVEFQVMVDARDRTTESLDLGATVITMPENIDSRCRGMKFLCGAQPESISSEAD